MNLIYPPLVNSFKVCLTKVKLELVAVHNSEVVKLLDLSKCNIETAKSDITGE